MRETSRTSPTIVDVARAARVSTATVSRALSNPDRVSEQTRRIVQDAIEATGFAINHAARSLRQQRTGIIVVLVPNLGNPFFSRILAGIEAGAAAEGFSVLIADTRAPHAGEGHLLEYIRNNRADALISLDGNLPASLLAEPRAGSRAPPLVFSCEWSEHVHFPSVRFDNAGGASAAIRYLAGQGHRRIGHVRGPAGNVLTRERERGLRETMAGLGLDLREDWILPGDFTLDSGVSAARRFLALADRPSAVFTANDEMAFGFISELVRSGLSVPRDVSVIGFDDLDMAERFIPALSTIRQPRHDIGMAAASIVLALLTGGADQATTRMLEAELVVRDSVAPI